MWAFDLCLLSYQCSTWRSSTALSPCAADVIFMASDHAAMPKLVRIPRKRMAQAGWNTRLTCSTKHKKSTQCEQVGWLGPGVLLRFRQASCWPEVSACWERTTQPPVTLTKMNLSSRRKEHQARHRSTEYNLTGKTIGLHG
jgi:hypothetical protein